MRRGNASATCRPEHRRAGTPLERGQLLGVYLHRRTRTGPHLRLRTNDVRDLQQPPGHRPAHGVRLPPSGTPPSHSVGQRRLRQVHPHPL